MPRYTEGFKEQIVQKMMPPNAQSIAQISRETGVCVPTLYTWKNRYQNEGRAVPADPSNPENWSGQDKLAVVIEIAALNEQELSEYCRKKGLYAEQIELWKEAAIAGNENPERLSKTERREFQQLKKSTRKTEKDLRRKEKALAEAAALLIPRKKPIGLLGGRRGRMIPSEDRQKAIEWIDEAMTAGARQHKACEVLEIDARTLRRWQQQLREEQRLTDRRKEAAANRTPANKLREEERQQIVEICNQPEYKSLPPSQIVPMLADQGQYIASESSYYRVLRSVDQVNRRGRAEASKTRSKPKGYKAEKPNAVWSWDITYLASALKGHFYYLYLIEDIFSRKIVGWEIHEEESAAHASQLIQKACLSEGTHQDGLVLHSDNGSPMKGATMLATLQKLGVIPSFSRPSVSDDNPYSESLFRTLKYTPSYPRKPFESLDEARKWVHGFVQWYNEEHRHSSIRFVTPSQRHNGKDSAILEKRNAVYEAAKERNPTRWSGDTRDWSPVTEVWLNPPKEIRAEEQKLPKAA
ncbi:MAG: IS3 family transposase [Gammaproteobacteria bacterium]|nr:IS3 family transposase [Gammaproteobacteria bacterium]